jgi:hypothetical protein
MRVRILRGIAGSAVDDALPARYRGLADSSARRHRQLTVLLFPDRHVATSADAARALGRLDADREATVAFMRDATVEALNAFQAAAVRTFTLRSFGWTDERYANVRQPKPRERDKAPR